MYVVFFDLETSGLNPETDDIIQIAAVATDHKFNELERFEVKIQFQVTAEKIPALTMNSYDAAVWKREAYPPIIALNKFASFLNSYRSVHKISKTKGTPYKVALLAGHNSEGFDRDFLFKWAKRVNPKQFLAAEWFTFDTLQIQSTNRVLECLRTGKELHTESMRLEDLVQFDGSHDALADVVATVELAKKLTCDLVGG